ncbi:MAG TPA: hypothetical protein VF695_14565 [Sphingomonas sp.]|jgi:hypothetical protein
MLAAILYVLVLIALLLALGFGALATFLGSVVAAVAMPGDRPVEIPARAAGTVAAAFGLILFIIALLTLLRITA